MAKDDKGVGNRNEESFFRHGKKKDAAKGSTKGTPKGTPKVKGARTTRKRALARVCSEVIAGEVIDNTDLGGVDSSKIPTTGFVGYAADILGFLTLNPALGTQKDITFQFKKPDPITDAALAFLKKNGDIFITDTGFIVAKGVLVDTVKTMKNACEQKGFVEISDLRNEYGQRYSRKLMMLLLDLVDESGCFHNSDNRRYLPPEAHPQEAHPQEALPQEGLPQEAQRNNPT